jgi:hypothetical protein
MKIRATIAAVGTAAALGLTGTILLPAAAAGAGTVTHTLTFTSVQKSQVKFSSSSSGSADLDVNKAGKVIGFDMLNFTVNPATGKVAAGVTVDTAGGFLYGTLKLSSGPVIHGTVTGGTGAFAGATGTITATQKTATRTAVTITYNA